MTARIKLEGSEMWEMVSVPTEEEKKAAQERQEAALEAAQSAIIAHASTLSICYEAEDGEGIATMRELMLAVETARTEELEGFLRGRVHRIPFEDGYLAVRF